MPSANIDDCPKAVQNIGQCVGNTPLVQITRAITPGGGNVFAKLEMQNPGGSVKDRIGLRMIEAAEKRGEITPGKTTIVEYSSGNTGIGLSMVCAMKGYKCIICMPQVPAMAERFVNCRKYGAEVHLTTPFQAIKTLLDYTKELAASNKDYWMAGQLENKDNMMVHYETTGPEIWHQLDGKVDCFIAGAGTGGTLVGTAKFLKEKNPNCKVIMIEPEESRIMVGAPPAPHTIVGIGIGIEVPFVKAECNSDAPYVEGPRGFIDEFLCCNGGQALEHADALACREGIMGGPSSGAAMKVAAEVAARPEMKGKNIVCIMPSNAIRYLKHPMFAMYRAECDEALPAPPNMDPTPILRGKYGTDETPAEIIAPVLAGAKSSRKTAMGTFARKNVSVAADASQKMEDDEEENDVHRMPYKDGTTYPFEFTKPVHAMGAEIQALRSNGEWTKSKIVEVYVSTEGVFYDIEIPAVGMKYTVPEAEIKA